MRETSLETPLYDILGARSPLLKRFEKIGIRTVRDLLWHFPSRYEDFSKIYQINDLEPGQQATIHAAVEDMKLRRTRRGLTIIEAILADESGTIRAVWFNQPYIAQTLRAGRIANFAGKISLSEENELYLNNPAYEILRQGTENKKQETSHTARLVPIYPETKGLTSRGIRFAVRIATKHDLALTEWIPKEILARYDFPNLQNALQKIHFPDRLEDALRAQKRFRFENLFLLQLFNFQQKLKFGNERAAAIPINIERIKHILAALPFSLTQSQKQSLWEIVQDLAKPHPMNRLLQGDVGSGKTIVAAIAAVTAAEHGFQTVFMAPTEILARQHFETFQKFLTSVSPSDHLTIGLAMGSGTTILYENDLAAKTAKKEFWKKSAGGEIAVIFGTHALIQKSAQFKNLGLVIVDEQHRFGVRQRQALVHKQSTTPHFLSMSATPIPRTLTMTVFGNLDLSLITELPAGRKPIATKIVAPLERQATYEFVRGEIKKGRQAFVICPLITPAEADDERANISVLELKSVEKEYEKLSKRIFPELRIAMLHGKMKPKEKESIMRGFTEKKCDMLVATSIIEVGVDIPNASVMIIEGADRFGLAQLYQFRGRIGRGEHQSYCFLMTDTKGDKAKTRLQAILRAKNGFELAEEDLKLRGPGEFFGEVQSGFSDATLEALRDPTLVKTSREAAIEMLQRDQKLTGAPLLRTKLALFRKTLHRE
jgi:ATP-dependent DNA helicase RecG